MASASLSAASTTCWRCLGGRCGDSTVVAVGVVVVDAPVDVLDTVVVVAVDEAAATLLGSGASVTSNSCVRSFLDVEVSDCAEPNILFPTALTGFFSRLVTGPVILERDIFPRLDGPCPPAPSSSAWSRDESPVPENMGSAASADGGCSQPSSSRGVPISSF